MKYHSIATEVNGIRFPSRLEAERYEELVLLQKAGKINHLKLQVEFTISRAFRSAEDGEKFRSVIYVADFAYFESETGRWVVEDTKGVETSTFKNKWRQCRELYPEYDWRILKRRDV